ncbi:MAG: hypothetical protein Q9219_006229 [cf. Caloplaca sp. 3 TL-2023]
MGSSGAHWLNDPWEWTIDQVVTTFCDPTLPFRATKDPRVLPNPTFLEQKLREQCIEGCTLLTDIDHRILKEELGILPLGQRGHILREIREFRRKSPRYSEYIHNTLPEPPTGYWTANRYPSNPSGPHSAVTATPAPQPATPVSYDAGQPHLEQPSTSQQSQQWLDQLPDQLEPPVAGETSETVIPLSEPPKQPTGSQTVLVPEGLQAETSVANDSSDPTPPATQSELSSEKPEPLPPQETYIVDKNGRKRRRLVLTAPASTDARDQQGEAAFSKTDHDEDHDQSRPFLDESSVPDSAASIHEPGTAELESTYGLNEAWHSSGAAALISYDGSNALDANTRPEHSHHKAIGEGYLGTRASCVDDIFYENAQITSKTQRSLPLPRMIDNFSDGSDTFVYIGASAGNGKRRYIKSRLQYYLQQKVEPVQRGSRSCLGLRPYPDRLGPKSQPLSISIFKSTPGGIIATRENRAEWSQEDPSSLTVQVQRSTSHDVNVFNVPLSFNETNGEDWDYLEKWNYTTQGSTVLPLFGESGSEGEYDSATRLEIEREIAGKHKKPLIRRKQKRELSKEQVLHAIKDAVQSMIEDWKQKRLPQLLWTAWGLWTKSRRKKTKHAQILHLSSNMQHLNDRLDKQRQEVANATWGSVAKVGKQCESLRETIYDLREADWKITTLQLKSKPEHLRKPDKVGSKIAGAQKQLLDEGMSSSAAETLTQDDLDDFIVDDQDSAVHDDNAGTMNMVEDDETTDDEESKASDASAILQMPQPKGKGTEADMLVSKVNKKEPSSQLQQQPSGGADIIDLTLDSDTGGPEAAPSTPCLASDARKTPTVSTIATDEDPFQRSQRKKAEFRIPPTAPNVIDLDNDSAYDSPPNQSTSPQLPELQEWGKISQMDPKLLMERADRKRLLIYVLTRVDLTRRYEAYDYIHTTDYLSAWVGVERSIQNILRLDSDRKEVSKALKDITAWYVYWTNAVIVRGAKGANKKHLKIAGADKDGFRPFYDFLHELRCLIEFEKPIDDCQPKAEDVTLNHFPLSTPSKDGNRRNGKKTKRVAINYSDEDGDVHPTSGRKKRKYEVPESQEAAELRKKTHDRVVEQDERQRRLKRSMRKTGQTEDDPSHVAVNLGKLDSQELIYLPPSIGAKIQPHQKDGVRFLWREIIEDHASRSGCLLAQTMGLGKTMQVISFLVAVAEAANSPTANVRDQIPCRLRESRTLVLCPPTLIENWYEEFQIWGPDDMAESIGDVRKVTVSMLPYRRLQVIEEWDEGGGILILGYTVFRELIDNAPNGKTKQTPLDDDQHRSMTDILLGRPNIVVADEAHMAKNKLAKLSQVIARFSTGSRIALTGSPLSNNLSEYYALIQWVAPGYLGEHREFKAHYEEPIQEGLYCDSSISQWRTALKKLELFKREVEPKVHRADLSVLASRLKGKSEFVIKVDLTPLQRELYQMFVGTIDERYGGTEGPRTSALWTLMSTLRLVCNHPKCFRDNLLDKERERTKEQAAFAEQVDEDGASLLELGISKDVIQQQLKPFDNLNEEVDALSLAYKMKLLLQILQLARAVDDKVLIFTHSLLTLDYIEHIMVQQGQRYLRLDGKVSTARRQQMTKNFNRDRYDVFIISTKAGGTGLNLFGANRVVIVDNSFNPTHEEQAVGRAYRIGQTKHVFVYRLSAAGTFEEALNNQSLFKQQLATRAVDKKKTARLAVRNADYLKPLKDVEQQNLGPFMGKDPIVLDKILESQAGHLFIRDIVPCETFRREIDEELTAEEQKEVQEEEELSRLRRTDPAAYQAKVLGRLRVSNPPSLPLPEMSAGFVPAESVHPNSFNSPLPDTTTPLGPQNVRSSSQAIEPIAAKSPLKLVDQSKTAESLHVFGSEGVDKGVHISGTVPILANHSSLPHLEYGHETNPSNLHYTNDPGAYSGSSIHDRAIPNIHDFNQLPSNVPGGQKG